MTKRPLPLPDRSEITDDTPLHFETAARLAFPDGVVTGLGLRNAAYRGDLEFERLGGRIVTTLHWIKEWRERNRHPAKPAGAVKKPAHLDAQHRAAAVASAYRIAAEMRAEPKKNDGEAMQAATARIDARLQTLSKPNRINDNGKKLKGKTGSR